MKRHIRKLSAFIINVKVRIGTAVTDIPCVNIRIIVHPEGDHLPADTLQRIHGVCIIGICNNDSAVFRHLGSENPEAALDLFQILEKVKMIRFNIEHNRNRRIK